MSKQTAPAVILSHGEGGLGAARSLARRHVEVTVIAYDPDDTVLHSRFPVKKIVVPGNDDKEKQKNVLQILAELDLTDAALLTSSDRLVTLISDNRDELSGKYRFALPSKELLDALNDKSREVDMLEELGFATPRTVTSLPDTAGALAETLRFPIIFKPHSYAEFAVFPDKNAVVHDIGELEAFYEEWEHALVALLAQEVITGPDTYSWVCSGTYDHSHDLLDCGVKQKIRCIPAHFGGSTLAVSKRNEDVVELSRTIGKQLRYVGHAGLEFRWDDRDDCYRFIEINPRFPANVGFDADCGLPTAWNSYQVALGNNPKPSGAVQADDVYFVDLRGDLESMRADDTPVSTMATQVLSLLWKRKGGLYFAWDDPRPGLAIASRYLGGLLQGAARRFRRLIGS